MFIYKRLHTWVIGGLNIFIKDIVEYINVEVLDAPVIGGLSILLKIW
jgi:hypothetical protein